MKKLSFLAAALLAVALGGKAEKVTMVASNRPEIKLTPQYPKAPMRPLAIDLTDYTLTVPYAFEDIVPVELMAADGETVYTDCLYPGETTLTLPESLSGSYTLCLGIGSLCYIGNVEF